MKQFLFFAPYKRIIPILLYKGEGLVKTRRFRNPVYIGDPINAVKIFNEKKVDELVFLDLNVCGGRLSLNFNLIEEIAGECFMPLSYGGGIYNVDQIIRLNRCGVEKVIINTAGIQDFDFLSESVKKCGSSSIVGSIDYRRNPFGKQRVYIKGGSTKTKWHPLDLCLKFQDIGVGEIIVNSIDRDGEMLGLDLPFAREVSEVLKVPLIVAGGAGNNDDLKRGFEAGASAVAAGSMFVFQGPHKAVLISYINQEQLLK